MTSEFEQKEALAWHFMLTGKYHNAYLEYHYLTSLYYDDQNIKKLYQISSVLDDLEYELEWNGTKNIKQMKMFYSQLSNIANEWEELANTEYFKALLTKISDSLNARGISDLKQIQEEYSNRYSSKIITPQGIMKGTILCFSVLLIVIIVNYFGNELVSSLTFTSPLFLFVLLPIVSILYSFFNPRWRNILISVASLCFFLLGDPAATLVLLVIVAANWGFGLAIDDKKANGRSAAVIAGLAIACNLAALAYYKYSGFVVETVNSILRTAAITTFPVPNIIAPLGISFLTFTAISYIIDILRGDAEAYRNPHHTFLFLATFPKVVAGPITTFKSMAGQVLAREWSSRDALHGGARFILGLAKKVLIADTIGVAVNHIFSLPTDQLTTPVAWIGAVGYTLQLYFDFSGYSDMAIGLGRVFGFRFTENFNYPYISTSVREFWRRWHISLTNWFREYLYIPLGGNRTGQLRMYVNLMIVFILCGFWHGANWTFIVWGAWHGLFLVLERLPAVKSLNSSIARVIGANNLYAIAPIKYAYTMLVVILGWVFFRSGTLAQALGFVQAMFGFGNSAAMAMPGWYLSNSVIVALVLAVILSWPIASKLLAAAREMITIIESRTTVIWSEALTLSTAFIAVAVLLLFSIMMATSRGFQPFIYANF